MKKHLKKTLWGAVMVFAMTGTFALGNAVVSQKTAAPQQIEVSQAAPETASDGTLYAQREATIIVYYYRVHNGWLQRRKYNRTAGCWAESKWHNVKRANIG